MGMTYILKLYDPPIDENSVVSCSTPLWKNFQNHMHEKFKNPGIWHTRGLGLSDIYIETADDYGAKFLSTFSEINQRPIALNAVAMEFSNTEDAVEFILTWS
jgi:hypothetical protein